MKRTVLDMVQEILSSLSSDEVNSISDTAESMQVASILKTVFNNITARGDFGEHSQMFQLNASEGIGLPTLMTKPDSISRIEWIKYYNQDDGAFDTIPSHAGKDHDINTDIQNTNIVETGQVSTSAASLVGSKSLTFNSTPTWINVGQSVTDLTNSAAIPVNTTVTATTYNTVTISNAVVSPGVSSGDIISFSPLNFPIFYEYVTILPIVQFLDMVNTFNPDDDDVDTYSFQNINLRYKNDKKPQYCTVLQDYYILFDSYQALLDDTLQSSKTLCFGQLLPVFNLVDTFIPNLDDKQFPLLVNEAKTWAWYELKQMPHQKSEQEAKRQWAVAQKNKSIVNKPTYFEALPDFGRRSWGASWSPYVYKSSRRFNSDFEGSV